MMLQLALRRPKCLFSGGDEVIFRIDLLPSDKFQIVQAPRQVFKRVNALEFIPFRKSPHEKKNVSYGLWGKVSFVFLGSMV